MVAVLCLTTSQINGTFSLILITTIFLKVFFPVINPIKFNCYGDTTAPVLFLNVEKNACKNKTADDGYNVIFTKSIFESTAGRPPPAVERPWPRVEAGLLHAHRARSRARGIHQAAKEEGIFFCIQQNQPRLHHIRWMRIFMEVNNVSSILN